MLDTSTIQSNLHNPSTINNRSLIINQALAQDNAILGKNLFTLNNSPIHLTALHPTDNNQNFSVDTVASDLIHFGLWVNGDCDIQSIVPYLPKLNLIAIVFPKVVDGRGYSLAYLLRNRLKFTGELRAVGDFTRDQLFFLQRTGFNAMTLRAGEDVPAALSAFNAFSIRYQGSTDTPNPLFVEQTRQQR